MQPWIYSDGYQNLIKRHNDQGMTAHGLSPANKPDMANYVSCMSNSPLSGFGTGPYS